jgi:hypothetical protein
LGVRTEDEVDTGAGPLQGSSNSLSRELSSQTFGQSSFSRSRTAPPARYDA